MVKTAPLTAIGQVITYQMWVGWWEITPTAVRVGESVTALLRLVDDGGAPVVNAPCQVHVTRPDATKFDSAIAYTDTTGRVTWAFTLDQVGTWTFVGEAYTFTVGSVQYLGCPDILEITQVNPKISPSLFTFGLILWLLFHG